MRNTYTYTLSNHCAIAWRVAKQKESENRPPKTFTGWKASASDTDAMRLCMEGGCAEDHQPKKKWKT